MGQRWRGWKKGGLSLLAKEGRGGILFYRQGKGGTNRKEEKRKEPSEKEKKLPKPPSQHKDEVSKEISLFLPF